MSDKLREARLYQRKPGIIEAVCWTGDNGGELREFVGEALTWAPNKATSIIVTLEGMMDASKGDWIIRGVEGEFYPCKPNIFAKNYERAALTGAASVGAGELVAALKLIPTSVWRLYLTHEDQAIVARALGATSPSKQGEGKRDADQRTDQ